jgi:mono/diheme cytochrome c family protein
MLRALGRGSCVLLVIVWAVGGPAVAAEAPDGLAAKAQAVLKAHCVRCHGPGGKGGFDHILDRDKLVAGGRVVPGKPAASELFVQVRDGAMPPREVKARPSQNEVALLEQWITAGAPAAPRTVLPRTFVTKAELLRHILADLQTLTAAERRFVRYVSLLHAANAGQSDSDLETSRLALFKLLNALSWHPRLHLPQAVEPGQTLFRVDLRALKWTGRLWDRVLAFYPYRLANASSDARAIAAATGSELPYIRADWFIATASRAPLYYDLLDLPATDRALERLLQVDAARDIEELNVVRAGFNGSGVSANNRLIERHDAAHGAYWKTYDFSANTEKQNLFEHPLGPPPAGNAFVHAGGEMIYHLPNGLLGFFVADSAGRRLDRAPVEIVSDPQRPDKAVEAGLSCFACHSAGFIPKVDQVRAHVLKNAQAFPREDLEVVQALYAVPAKLKGMVAEDSQRHLQALERLGVKKDAAEPITAATLRYEGTVDLATVAAEVGLRPADFAERLRRSPTLSRSLGALQARGGTVQRQTLINAFPELVRELRLDEPAGQTVAGTASDFTGHTAPIRAIAVSADGKLAVSGSEDRTLRLWDVQTGRELRRFEGHRAAVTAVAFSPDGRRIVSGSADRTLRLWDVESGRERRVLSGHTDAISAVAFAPDGRRILSGSLDRTLLLWDAETGQELRAFTGHDGRISSIAFAPDGKLALSGSHDRSVCLWDVKTGKMIRTIGGLGEVYAVAFAPDGRSFATGGNERVVRLWAVANGRELRRLEGHGNAVIGVAFAPDGQTVLSASSQYQSPDRTIRLWDPATGQEKRSFAGPERERVSCAGFASTGTFVLTDSVGQVLRRWTLE